MAGFPSFRNPPFSDLANRFHPTPSRPSAETLDHEGCRRARRHQPIWRVGDRSRCDHRHRKHLRRGRCGDSRRARCGALDVAHRGFWHCDKIRRSTPRGEIPHGECEGPNERRRDVCARKRPQGALGGNSFRGLHGDRGVRYRKHGSVERNFRPRGGKERPAPVFGRRVANQSRRRSFSDHAHGCCDPRRSFFNFKILHGARSFHGGSLCARLPRSAFFQLG